MVELCCSQARGKELWHIHVSPLLLSLSRTWIAWWRWLSSSLTFLTEAQRNASYKETLDCISGCSSRPQGVSKHKLKPVRESLLQGWFQPEQNTVWLETKLFSKLNGLKLTPEKQSLVDSGIWMG